MRIPAAALALLLLAVPAAAQTTLRGQVVDTAGAPLADQPVVLHTVTSTGGESVGETRSDASGAFALAMPEKVPTEAVVFAAVRADGELYLGPMLEGGSLTAEPYVIVVGGASAMGQLGAATAPPPGAMTPGMTPPPPAGGRAWLSLIVFLPLAALLGFFLFRLMGDPDRERRRLVLELARAEESLHASRIDADERASLEARRDALRGRLLATTATGQGDGAAGGAAAG